MIAWPVIVDEHGDVMVFEDQRAIRAQLEAVDVEAGEYVFFDADGWELEPLVDADGLVTVGERESPRGQQARLAGIVSRYLHAVAPAAPERAADRAPAADELAELVSRLRALHQRLHAPGERSLAGSRWDPRPQAGPCAERDRLVQNDGVDSGAQQVWEVIEGFANARGSQVRFDRARLGSSGYEVASIIPLAAGAASLQVLVSAQEAIVCVGVGGRYELGVGADDAGIVAALLEGVAAGGYVEDVGWGVGYRTTLADGEVMSGSQHDLFRPAHWGRHRRLTYQPYAPAAPGSVAR